MKIMKKALAVVLCIAMISVVFAGCSSNKEEKYTDKTLIIGYTESAAPFLEVDENGKATGFEAELWKAIFNNVKGELTDYVFEQIEEGYRLEEDGGFFDSTGKEFDAGLLFGAVSKNNGTFNEDYSFTEPIITDRVVALTTKDSDIITFADFEKANAIVVGTEADKAFKANRAIYDTCKSVKAVDSLDEALALLDSKKADVLITNELTLNPTGKAEKYSILENYLDVIEYVIAVPKYSGWKDSINEAIRELKDVEYDGADNFTPLVEKYFGYNASSFNYDPNKK